MGQPWLLSVVWFHSLQKQILQQKTVGFSGIPTSDHQSGRQDMLTTWPSPLPICFSKLYYPNREYSLTVITVLQLTMQMDNFSQLFADNLNRLKRPKMSTEMACFQKYFVFKHLDNFAPYRYNRKSVPLRPSHFDAFGQLSQLRNLV